MRHAFRLNRESGQKRLAFSVLQTLHHLKKSQLISYSHKDFKLKQIYFRLLKQNTLDNKMIKLKDLFVQSARNEEPAGPGKKSLFGKTSFQLLKSQMKSQTNSQNGKGGSLSVRHLI